jgi:hypothetical protein
MRWRGFDRGLARRLLEALAAGEGRLEAVLAADPALPCKPVLARWRREVPAFDRAVRAALAAQRRRREAVAGLVQAELIAAVTRAIRLGGSFASVGRAPGMPTRQTLRRWYRRDADFAAAVDRACAARELWLTEQILEAAGDWRAKTRRGLQAELAPLVRARARLAHRPGATWTRRPGSSHRDLAAGRERVP